MAKKRNKGADDQKSAPKFNRSNIENQEQAEKIAQMYIPEDDEQRYVKIQSSEGEVMVDKFDVMYVTGDGNVFYKESEGSANLHAKKQRLKVFTVKFD